MCNETLFADFGDHDGAFLRGSALTRSQQASTRPWLWMTIRVCKILIIWLKRLSIVERRRRFGLLLHVRNV